MTTITCLKELEERRELERGDIIIFIVNKEILKYKIEEIHINKNIYLYNTISSGGNDKIFRILEINKSKLAKKIYGYEAANINSAFYDINWAEAKENDYPALTRLITELYRIIEERETVFTKFTRFEIMDI